MLLLLLLLLLSLLYMHLCFINETTKPGMHLVTEHVPIYISLLADDFSYHKHVRTHWAIWECVNKNKQIFPPEIVFAFECKRKSRSKNECMGDILHCSSK
jgi:hypothetical protein